jgi:integrase
VRTNLEQLIGGATEETIIARVGEGIITSIGSAESHKQVLENPDRISKTVLQKGLDAGTAFTILSIDIADIDVGENIGAKLQADQAEADKRRFQAEAEKRRAMAVAQEQEFKAEEQKNRALVVLRETFEIGMDLGLCDSNPARQVKTVAQSKRTRRLTDAEFNRIRACAKGKLPLIMDVLYYTGQRIGDVLAIRQSDISDGVIHFVQQKTGAPLDIEIGPDLDKAIKAARSGPVAGLWLFSKHGKPMSYFTVQSAYKAACERARVEGTTLHDIRAKAITDLSLIGGDAKALAGHTDQKMTDRYIRERVVPRVKSLDTSKTIDRKTQQ